MKWLWLLTLSLSAQAQTVDVKDVNTQGEGSTTIEIHKNKPNTPKTEALWEVQDGQADVEGDVAATEREAKANHKKACDQWKKEFREDNKDNRILSMSCGTATCSGEVGQKTCTSKAVYKVKTKLN